MQVRRSAAGGGGMDAGHQVAEGNALAAASGAGGGPGGSKEPAGLPCPRCESTDTKFCYYNNYNLGQPRHFCKGCRRYWTRGGALRNVPVGGGMRKPSPAARRKRVASASASSSSSSNSSTAPQAPSLLLLPPPPSSSAPLSASTPAAAAYDLPPPPFTPAAALVASPLDWLDPDHRTLDHHERRLLDHHNRRMLLDPDRRLLDLGGSFTSLLAPAPAHDARFSSTGFLVGGLPPVTPPPPPASSSSAPPPALLPPVSQALPDGLIWGMGWPDLSI